MTRQGGWPPSGFGGQLKLLREEAGISQAQLAERAGCHLLTISKIERGVHEPAWPLVQALARALGVTCAAFDVLAGDAPAPPEPQPRGRPRKAESAEPAAGKEKTGGGKRKREPT
jgi:transcriptional regulator with XRE-family HTH domain